MVVGRSDLLEVAKTPLGVEHEQETKGQIGHLVAQHPADGCRSGLPLDDGGAQEFTEASIAPSQLADLLELVADLDDLLLAARLLRQLEEASSVDHREIVELAGHGLIFRARQC